MKSEERGRWEVVTSSPEFLGLETEWEELFALNPCHRPFLAWGWVTAWLKHLAGAHQLHIVCLRDAQGTLQYVLPLIYGTAGGRYGKPRYLVVCGYGADCSDHLGCLRHPNFESETAELSAIAINRFCKVHTRIELNNLDGLGEFPQKLASMLRKEGRVVRLAEQAACPAVALADTWDEHALNLSSNFRSQVRRHHKRIANHDAVRYRAVDIHGAALFTEELIRLNRTRIHDKGDVSSLEQEEFRDFLVEAVPYMAQQGLAWMDVVESGKDTFGAALNLIHGETVYYYMGGFAESAKSLRPGTALFVQAIKRAIDSGFRCYDFLRGAETYKYRWGAVNVPVYQLTVYPKNMFRALIDRMFDECVDWARVLTRRIRQVLQA